MADFMYRKYLDALLSKEEDWIDDPIKVVLVTSAYTSNQDNHEFLSDIPAPARIATSNALTGKSVSAGIADADNAAFPATSGAQCNAYVIYHDTGSDGTSRLIVYVDGATGLPFTPTGGSFNINWPDSQYKIFALGYSS